MIFIAGGTGFVGKHLLDAMRGSATPVRCLIRDRTKGDWLRARGVEAVEGDVCDRASLRNTLDGVRAVVHLVGIIAEREGAGFDAVHRQGTENLVNEAAAAGVEQFFYQSALGADPESPYEYLKTKAQAEQVVANSNMSYAIFRPSLIVGSGDGFTLRTKQLLSAGPVVPVPGSGEARFQPLYIGDWIQSFQSLLVKDKFENRIYELGGPEHLTYIEILTEIMEVLEISKRIVHIPMGVMRATLPFMGVGRRLASALGREIPAVTDELLSLLNQDNICDLDVIQKSFGFEPIRFADALKEFL